MIDAPAIPLEIVPATARLGISAADPRPHFVYVVRDKNGVPLYVGISISFAERFVQHSRESRWWFMARRFDLERCRTRRDALERETDLINDLQPLFNVAKVISFNRAAVMKYLWDEATDEERGRFLDWIIQNFRLLFIAAIARAK